MCVKANFQDQFGSIYQELWLTGVIFIQMPRAVEYAKDYPPQPLGMCITKYYVIVQNFCRMEISWFCDVFPKLRKFPCNLSKGKLLYCKLSSGKIQKGLIETLKLWNHIETSYRK